MDSTINPSGSRSRDSGDTNITGDTEGGPITPEYDPAKSLLKQEDKQQDLAQFEQGTTQVPPSSASSRSKQPDSVQQPY